MSKSWRIEIRQLFFSTLAILIVIGVAGCHRHKNLGGYPMPPQPAFFGYSRWTPLTCDGVHVVDTIQGPVVVEEIAPGPSSASLPTVPDVRERLRRGPTAEVQE